MLLNSKNDQDLFDFIYKKLCDANGFDEVYDYLMREQSVHVDGHHGKVEYDTLANAFYNDSGMIFDLLVDLGNEGLPLPTTKIGYKPRNW